MRPSDDFVRPRLVATADSDATVTQLSSGISGPVGVTLNNTLSGAGVGGPSVATAPMMTYFLADENDVDAALEAAGRDAEGFRAAILNVRHIRGKPTAPTPAHSSVPKTSPPAPAAGAAELDHHPHRPAEPSRPATPEAQIQHGPRPTSIPPTFSPMFSQSGSASLLGTPGPASLSAMSSPSSRRNSLSSSFMMDDRLSSGGGGEDAELSHAGPAAAEPSLALSSPGLSTVNNSALLDSGSAPQLIMPSIKMPSRRPFTEIGKGMGRLRVLLAGDTGVGKTSLVKAIVQSCPHIVHVDHISPTSFSLGTSRRSSAVRATASSSTADAGRGAIYTRRRPSRSAQPSLSTSQISEIYASTKPYPVWWNELSESREPQRRKSLGDSVLDRNICFVDTPGFTGSASPMDAIMPVVEHVEGHLHKLCSNALDDADFIGLVSGDGGAFVDAVFYLVVDSLKPADIEFLRRLIPLTNVIPLLAQADMLGSDKEVADAKERIARQLHEAGIKPFVFTVPTEEHELNFALPASSGLPQPYAVSSANSADQDVMDASLLMSPDYVQPLVSTDLSLLVEQVFCQDGVSRLRHAAARKIAQWRRPSLEEDRASNNYAPRPQSLYRPLSMGTGAGGPNELGIFSGAANAVGGGHTHPGVLTAALGAPSSFALARITDHTQREEQLAQIRLASWAAELQRSLDNERAQYERLARSERAMWLTERLGECVKDGTLVAGVQQQQQQQHLALPSKKQQARKSTKSGRKSMWASASSNPSSSSKLPLPTSFSHEDPLGLLQVTAGLRARSLFVLEVLGSLGVLGGAALWMASHNYHIQLYEWAVAEWTKLWNGEY